MPSEIRSRVESKKAPNGVDSLAMRANEPSNMSQMPATSTTTPAQIRWSAMISTATPAFRKVPTTVI